MQHPPNGNARAGEQRALENIRQNNDIKSGAAQAGSQRSPFQCSAPALRAIGYSVIPLEERSKSTKMRGWTNYCQQPASDITFHQWLIVARNANIGVCLGPASNAIGLDYDHDIDGLHEKIMRIVPPSPVQKMGAKGRTDFYQCCGEKSESFKVKGKDGKDITVFEILATGRQTVLPPSIHPDTGKEYVWLTPDTLETMPASELPVLTPEHIEAIRALFPDSKQNKPSAKREQTHRPRQNWHGSATGDYDDIAEIIEALDHIPADNYDLWYRIGMALKVHLGERGYDIYDRWSATSGKYQGSDETRRKWDSFNSFGVNINTLFFYAVQYGYRPRGRYAKYHRLFKTAKAALPPYYPHPRHDVEQAIAEQQQAIQSWFWAVYGNGIA